MEEEEINIFKIENIDDKTKIQERLLHDKKLLETLVTANLQGVHLEAISQLSSGSVRVLANDMVVEDLIENRLETLARGLALQDATPPIAQAIKDEGETEDVHS